MEKDLNNELGKSERLGRDLNIDGIGLKHSNNRFTWIGWVRRSIHHVCIGPHIEFPNRWTEGGTELTWARGHAIYGISGSHPLRATRSTKKKEKKFLDEICVEKKKSPFGGYFALSTLPSTI